MPHVIIISGSNGAGKTTADALLKHKQAGNPVCEWRNGKVVWIKPEDIKINKRK